MDQILNEEDLTKRKHMLSLIAISVIVIALVGIGGFYGYKSLGGKKAPNPTSQNKDTNNSGAVSNQLNTSVEISKIENDLKSVDADIASADNEIKSADDGLNDQPVDLN